MNELWIKLGLQGKRALIVHHDDLGLSRAQNRAYRELGFPTGSVMMMGCCVGEVSGPDLGVHLTLTSGQDSMRLHPLSPGSSLRNPQGLFWRTLEDAWPRLVAAEVEAELRAQIEAALRAFDVTHLDSHMGALLRPDLAEIYVRLAEEHRLPALIPGNLDDVRLPPDFLAALQALRERSALPQVTVVDGYGVPPQQRREWYLQALSGLGAGVYQLIHHAACADAEGQSLGDWQGRKADLEALKDPEVRRVIGEFELLTWREVREVWRGAV
ncbi:ChbG/HpnK family deacetylase [Calidithermus chliarophilus]|uniref:carbohydrate deacetylase n=1 Tax=Calidithermus chliarophilus TaxID=52023 RepID=UPI0004126C6D|nr:ChbG/HpnK family deacetylase [Calidithermus chliarophilus]